MTAPSIEELGPLLARVRGISEYHYPTAYQPENPDGAIYHMSPDFGGMSGGGNVEPQIVDALRRLYDWARTDPAAALESGLLVAEDLPDHDLGIWGVTFPAEILAALRRFHIKLVVLPSEADFVELMRQFQPQTSGGPYIAAG